MHGTLKCSGSISALKKNCKRYESFNLQSKWKLVEWIDGFGSGLCGQHFTTHGTMQLAQSPLKGPRAYYMVPCVGIEEVLPLNREEVLPLNRGELRNKDGGDSILTEEWDEEIENEKGGNDRKRDYRDEKCDTGG
eukprot:Gb_00412 [translate_table: standard]